MGTFMAIRRLATGARDTPTDDSTETEAKEWLKMPRGAVTAVTGRAPAPGNASATWGFPSTGDFPQHAYPDERQAPKPGEAWGMSRTAKRTMRAKRTKPVRRAKRAVAAGGRRGAPP